jgi:hypothetical protein
MHATCVVLGRPQASRARLPRRHLSVSGAVDMGMAAAAVIITQAAKPVADSVGVRSCVLGNMPHKFCVMKGRYRLQDNLFRCQVCLLNIACTNLICVLP